MTATEHELEHELDEPIDPHAADYDDTDEGAIDGIPIPSEYGSELEVEEVEK